MATLIQAFTAFGPKIELSDAAEPQRFMELITQNTTLSPGVVKNVQECEVETLIGLLKEGRPVHTGIAIFTPRIDLKGRFHISVRVDKRIVSALSARGAFVGTIKNNENIGKSGTEIAALWNEEHPEDQIDL